MATTSQKIILSDNIRLLVAAGVGDKMSVPDQILRSYPRSSYTSTKNRRACNKDTPGPDVNNEVQGLTDIERTINLISFHSPISHIKSLSFWLYTQPNIINKMPFYVQCLQLDYM